MAFSLIHLLRIAAEQRSEQTALEFGELRMSYGDLWDRSATIARVLADQGVSRGTRVGILMNRSFDSYAAIFGAMQAGATYVPFNASAPVSQLSAIIEDCEIRHVVLDTSHLGLARDVAAGCKMDFVLGGDAAESGAARGLRWQDIGANARGVPLNREAIEQDPCLIFFTSGSTGRPKGVVHSHRSMLANVAWAVETFQLRHEDRFTNVTSHHFDLSWLEMYASIGAQATIVMVPETTVRFPGELAALCERARPTVWCSVPSVLMQLTLRGNLTKRDLSTLRWVLFAGERFPTKNLKELMRLVPTTAYCNMFGTTETHIAAYYPIPPLSELADEPLPIGRPCAHLNLAIFKPDGSLATAGETGELAIRGPSVMDGYWRLPDRTRRVLQRHPIANGLEGLYYHAGDLARVRSDGLYEVIGRNDRRVKVRGYIVDLDEVEKVLLSHAAVHEVAAFHDAKDESGPVHAVATLHEGQELSPAQLRLHVGQQLPVYAVPQQIWFVRDLPRTGSAKISRADIPAFAAKVAAECKPPATPDINVRQAIRSYIVEELLSAQAPADFDDELELIDSGLVSSLAVARLVSFIEDQFGISVPNDEFVAENFVNLAASATLVERLLQRVHVERA